MHKVVHVQQREVGKPVRFEVLQTDLFLFWTIDRSGALTVRTESSSGERVSVRAFADGSWISVWGAFSKQV